MIQSRNEPFPLPWLCRGLGEKRTVARASITRTHVPASPRRWDRLKGLPTDAATMGCAQGWTFKEEGDELCSFHFGKDQLFGCSPEKKPEKHKELTLIFPF